MFFSTTGAECCGGNRYQNSSIAQLQDFEGHPFKVENDMALFELMQSIEKEGVIVLALARPKAGGGYEL